MKALGARGGDRAAGERHAKELALLQRTRAAATALGLSTGGRTSTELAFDLVEHVRARLLRDEAWLLLVSLHGLLPTTEMVDDVLRTLRLAGSADVLHGLLLAAGQGAPTDLARTLEVVADRPVVDVDFTARHDLHTGIQRVVRETVPRWSGRDLRLVAWNRERNGYRRLEGEEVDRVERYRRGSGTHGDPSPRLAPLVVPWRTTVVLPEVPAPDVTARLSALTEANRMVAVGYDCIPVVSADVLPRQEPVKFVRYLSMLKRADSVAAISEAAAAEFRGFTAMLPTQGLRGPDVVTVALPAESGGSAPGPEAGAGGPARDDGHGPYVLVVGSHDPRKNHLSVLHAAERLWLAGEEFRLVFAGSKGWRADEFDREVARLRREHRQVRVERQADDAMLWELYTGARFTMFPSVHEGFGLPVAESLAAGVPCITSRFGSMGEIAAGGGALTVDPNDDEDVFMAMARLLREDDLHSRLAGEARARTERSWEQYADELWSVVHGVQA